MTIENQRDNVKKDNKQAQKPQDGIMPEKRTGSQGGSQGGHQGTEKR